MNGQDSCSTALFLHGLAGHGGEWQEVVDLLDVQAVAPDLPGHGESFNPVSGHGPGHSGARLRAVEVVDAVESLVAEAGCGGPVILVGQSMGAVVAMRVAHRCPDLIAHLVLIEADTGAMSAESLDSLRAWFGRWPAAFADADEATQFFGADRPSTPAWVAGLQRTPDGLVGRFHADSLVGLMANLADDSSAELWRNLTVSCTLIVAANGTTSGGEVAAMLKAQPDTTVVHIADAGHDVHLDQPAAVAEAIAAVAAVNL